MKLHASTDHHGVTRFMIEHGDGSRTTFEAHVANAELGVERNYDAILDGFAHRHIPRMAHTTFKVSVNVLGGVIHTAAPYKGYSADHAIVDETQELP